MDNNIKLKSKQVSKLTSFTCLSTVHKFSCYEGMRVKVMNKTVRSCHHLLTNDCELDKNSFIQMKTF